jgi:UDP-N-acetylglucosamine pyrophosphorylase
MDVTDLEQAVVAKMRSNGVGGPTICWFLQALRKVVAGERGMIPEDDLEPVRALPVLAECAEPSPESRGLLRQLAVIKLNGGLGTSMGLDRAKSLIPVKGEATFLDFITQQLLHLREGGRRTEPAFYLMNSFVTQHDTIQYLRKYPELAAGRRLDFLQNRVPKLEASSFAPVSWPSEPELEWCPPGHGDLYPALLGSGVLDELTGSGVRYVFVSNSDNLGATVDLKVLEYFARSGLSFLMEVAERTAADRKGGHLGRARSTGRLLLRESAQCRKADESAFQDIQRHRFFNTNNLWVRLDRLREELNRHQGTLALPLITNTKTVDPKDSSSPKVLQLESAMGAAVECFERSAALVVPRTRFAPVKTTADLIGLRSDAYRVTEDFRLVLEPSRSGEPPLVELDPRHYRLMGDFERCFADGVPSLLKCQSLKVTGPIRFGRGVVCQGRVEFVNASAEPKTIAPRLYCDERVNVG